MKDTTYYRRHDASLRRFSPCTDLFAALVANRAFFFIWFWGLVRLVAMGNATLSSGTAYVFSCAACMCRGVGLSVSWLFFLVGILDPIAQTCFISCRKFVNRSCNHDSIRCVALRCAALLVCLPFFLSLSLRNSFGSSTDEQMRASRRGNDNMEPESLNQGGGNDRIADLFLFPLLFAFLLWLCLTRSMRSLLTRLGMVGRLRRLAGGYNRDVAGPVHVLVARPDGRWVTAAGGCDGGCVIRLAPVACSCCTALFLFLSLSSQHFWLSLSEVPTIRRAWGVDGWMGGWMDGWTTWVGGWPGLVGRLS